MPNPDTTPMSTHSPAPSPEKPPPVPARGMPCATTWPPSWRRDRQGGRRPGRHRRANDRPARKGHCLIVGVPGLAKTLLVSSLGQILGLSSTASSSPRTSCPRTSSAREILQTPTTAQREFEFAPGPIFANLILADEINRTPPKTQAALLEAMQEHQVTVGGDAPLDEPFIVFATQNPIEHEGTYPAARGPARPLLLRAPHRLPEHGRGRGRSSRHHRPRSPGPRCSSARRRARPPGGRHRRCPSPSTS